MKNPIASAYHARMIRVLDHVDAHLDEDLSADRLSGVAAFSRHHFHRQFSALFGLTVHRYVQLMRLRRACHRLAFREQDPITRIAFDSGYESHEGFSRAFRQVVGRTPTEFRQSPDWPSLEATCAPLHTARNLIMTSRFSDTDVQIVDFPATQVAVLEHRGDPARIGETVRRFIAWRRAHRLSPSISATYNVLHVDPAECAPADFRLDLCAALDGEVEPNPDGVLAGLIPAGRCAVLRHTGSDHQLGPAIDYLYGEWLPRSGEELSDFPIFVRRVTFFPDVPEQEAETLIHLPLADAP